jgi:hypothetical protein
VRPRYRPRVVTGAGWMYLGCAFVALAGFIMVAVRWTTTGF